MQYINFITKAHIIWTIPIPIETISIGTGSFIGSNNGLSITVIPKNEPNISPAKIAVKPVNKNILAKSFTVPLSFKNLSANPKIMTIDNPYPISPIMIPKIIQYQKLIIGFGSISLGFGIEN